MIRRIFYIQIALVVGKTMTGTGEGSKTFINGLVVEAARHGIPIRLSINTLDPKEQ